MLAKIEGKKIKKPLWWFAKLY